MTIRSNYVWDRRAVLLGGAALTATPMTGCKLAKSPKFDADIVILGAGLAGLHAARLLEADGREVLVLEGSDRIGGRMHTIDHGDGHKTEGGGEQIGANYARVLDTATTLGVAMRNDPTARRGTTIAYKDRLYSPSDWAKADDHPFLGRFKGASPASPLFALAAQKNPLKEATDWREATFSQYDQAANSFLKTQGFDADARAIIGHALNGNSLESYSMMNLYRTLQLYTQARAMGASRSVVGGAQRLPEAMAASLSQPVQMGRKVVEIRSHDDHVTVTDDQGRRVRARNCICALPYGALRHVSIDAPLAESQKQAIAALPYTQILQLHFKVDNPFWDRDELPADMWMDGPLERVFMNHDTDGAPTGYGRVWINGDGASALAGLPHEALDELLRNQISALRPVKADEISLLHVQRWTAQNSLSGGAYMHWAPGQISKWASNMGQPAGRLSFAGEHLSYLHTGMEGAMESGENAALALMDI